MIFPRSLYAIQARSDNCLLLGAINFQLRNFSEAVFFNQQAIRIEPQMAEAHSNLANALRELGDVQGSMRFYLKAIKCNPRFGDAYNNLATAHIQIGQIDDAIEAYQMSIVVDPGLVGAHCNLGNIFKAQGKLKLARQCYMEAIRLKPESSIAWSNLAGIFREEGQTSTAIAYYREAIRLCPQFADVYSNLGSAMQEQGNILEAFQCYRTAIRIRPDFAIAHGNLGSCLLASGDVQSAVYALRRAVQLEPNFPDAYNNLGNALRNLNRPFAMLQLSGKFGTLKGNKTGLMSRELSQKTQRKVDAGEAIECYRTVLRLQPNHPHAYSNLGNAMRDRGLAREAIHCNVTAARLMPSFAPAHTNLGSLLREQGQLDQAIAHYHQAIALDPDFAEAYLNLGNTYRDIRQLDDAIKCFTTAVNVSTHLAEGHAALAAAHGDKGNYEDAIHCYEQALSLNPNYLGAFAGLLQAKDSVCDWTMRTPHVGSLALVVAIQLQLDDYDDTILDYRRRSSASLVEQLESNNAWQKNRHVCRGSLPCIQPIDALALTDSIAPRDVQRLTRRFAARARANIELLALDLFRHHHALCSIVAPNESIIHVGYISSNFWTHSIRHLFVPLFKYHNMARFCVTYYSLSPLDQLDQGAQLVKSECELAGTFKDLSRITAKDAASVIHADGVHILAHLDGHTAHAHNEILALRPAPIQLTFVLGFHGTCGADYLDYLVADRIVLGPPKPPGAPGTQYDIDECALLLPNSCILNGHAMEYKNLLDDPPRGAPTRRTYGIPEDAFVFAYFGPLNWLDPVIFTTWMKILQCVPNAILWLNVCSRRSAVDRLKQECASFQVEEHRLFFTDLAERYICVSCNVLADLVLDTPGYNAVDATMDALWAGTPVVTFLGETIATRISASLCTAAGCPELVTDTLADYKNLATSLAVDEDKLHEYRQKLVMSRAGPHQAPLFDSIKTLKHLEAGYQAIWGRKLDRKAPTDILVVDEASPGKDEQVAISHSLGSQLKRYAS